MSKKLNTVCHYNCDGDDIWGLIVESLYTYIQKELAKVQSISQVAEW